MTPIQPDQRCRSVPFLQRLGTETNRFNRSIVTQQPWRQRNPNDRSRKRFPIPSHFRRQGCNTGCSKPPGKCTAGERICSE